MLITLQSRVIAKTIISMTWELYSISCGLTSWRWPDQIILGSVKWQVPWIQRHIQRNSLWSWQSQGNSRLATSEDPQRAQRFTRQSRLHLKIYFKSFGPLPTVYTVNEERRLLHMGWSLPKGFWGYQRIPHQASGPDRSHFEKTIIALCTSYGPLFERSFDTKGW